MDWLPVVMEEYKTIRSEVLQSMQTQQLIIIYGITAMAIVSSTGFTLWEKSPLPEIIFLLFIPIISYLVLNIFMGEIAKMILAGIFLMKLEDKVNKEFSNKPKALTWEHWTREGQYKSLMSQALIAYYAVICLFLLTTIASLGIGTYIVWNKIYCLYIFVIDIFEIILFIGVFLYIYIVGKRLRTLYKKPYSSLKVKKRGRRTSWIKKLFKR